MVKEIISYNCEFPGCFFNYPTFDEAKRCEDGGIVGPDMLKGLLLYEGAYMHSILLGEAKNKGHERNYLFLQLANSSVDTLLKYEKYMEDPDDFEVANFNPNPLEVGIFSLMNSFGGWYNRRFVNESDLNEWNRLIWAGNSLEKVRNELEKYRIDKLHNDCQELKDIVKRVRDSGSRPCLLPKYLIQLL